MTEDFREIGRNERCPCDSGRKYKVCCLPKDIQWGRDADGTLRERIPVDERLMSVVSALKARRSANGGEPIFGDVDPMALHRYMLDLAIEGGAHPAHLYAIERTERFLTEVGTKHLPDVHVAEWLECVNEYVAAHPETGRPNSPFLDLPLPEIGS